jgi:hypothetical protein
MNALISINGLQASNTGWNWLIVFARKGFLILGKRSRMEKHFSGTILYYFEVTKIQKDGSIL